MLTADATGSRKSKMVADKPEVSSKYKFTSLLM